MTEAEINFPIYTDLDFLAASLKAEAARPEPLPSRTRWPVRDVKYAVERALGCQWEQLSGRTKPVVQFRESMVGAFRELSVVSYPEITRIMRGVAHSGAHLAHQRYLRRPVAERAKFIAKVRKELERTA